MVDADDSSSSYDRANALAARADTPDSDEKCGIPADAESKSKSPFYNVVMDWLEGAIKLIDKHDGVVTAAATVAIACLTYSLASDSHRQAEIIKSQLDVMEAGQRAWINPFFAYGAFSENRPINYSIRYQNSGKSPAQGLHWAFNVGYFDTPKDDNGKLVRVPKNVTCENLNPQDSGASEFPPPQNAPLNEASPHAFDMNSSTTNPSLIADKAFFEDKHRFFIQGCVAYKTMNIIGKSQFCFYFVPVRGSYDLRNCGDGFAE